MSIRRRALGRAPHVCVVGAGMAGLRCAEVLIKNGYRTTIMEARDRIGGRVSPPSACSRVVKSGPANTGFWNRYTKNPSREGSWICELASSTDLGDFLVTHGASGPNWIHGSDKNPIKTLAEQTSTVLHRFDERQAIYGSDGQRLDEQEADVLTNLVWATIQKAIEESREHSTDIDPKKSLSDFFREEACKLFPTADEYRGSGESRRSSSRDDTQEARKAFLQMGEMWGNFVGTSFEHQSLRFFFLEENMDGGRA